MANPERARENREYVRRLLKEREPEFAAALEAALELLERELQGVNCPGLYLPDHSRRARVIETMRVSVTWACRRSMPRAAATLRMARRTRNEPVPELSMSAPTRLAASDMAIS
jgi:hypothetical protein